jgi:hypothetical protein
MTKAIVSITDKCRRVGQQSFAGWGAGASLCAGKGLPAYGCSVAETMAKAHGFNWVLTSVLSTTLP